MTATRGEVYDQLLDWLPSWALLQIAQALTDAHNMGYAEVRIEIREGRTTYIWIGEGRQMKNPARD